VTRGAGDAAPQTQARIGGALYLIIILVGVFGQLFVRGRLVVPGDAKATAERIQSSELLWRAAAAGELFLLLSCAVPLALIFYILLRPVSRELAMLAVFFNLLSIGIEAANKLHLLAALLPLGNAGYLRAFTPEQLSTLAAFSVRSEGQGFGISLIFFGWECIVLGYLIFRSGYLPRLIGVLMQIAGVCYLVNSLALIVSPSFQGRLLPGILIPAFIGEASLCLWLLVKGVDASKWRERAGA
jgi:hypothetical protein